MQSSIHTYLRLRPPFKTSTSEIQHVEKVSGAQVKVSAITHPLTFTHVFDDSKLSQNPQAQFCEGVIYDLQMQIREGKDCTIISYGGTACGKTFSIFGTKQHEGLLFTTMDCVFSLQKETEITMQLLQIYNEKVYDLSLQYSKELKGECEASVHPINSVEEGRQLFYDSYKNRQRFETKMNNLSGYSVIQVILKVGGRQITFIDLPGHQRSLGGSINKQVTFINNMLGNLQATLEALKLNKPLVPFRNTVLTKINIDRIRNSSLFLIVNINPFEKEAIETLRKASRFL